jgi:hypothetical protein
VERAKDDSGGRLLGVFRCWGRKRRERKDTTNIKQEQPQEEKGKGKSSTRRRRLLLAAPSVEAMGGDIQNDQIIQEGTGQDMGSDGAVWQISISSRSRTQAVGWIACLVGAERLVALVGWGEERERDRETRDERRSACVRACVQRQSSLSHFAFPGRVSGQSVT